MKKFKPFEDSYVCKYTVSAEKNNCENKKLKTSSDCTIKKAIFE